MKKTGRNDPCPCGSGKKFKKCCESSKIGGRYKATMLSAPQKSAQVSNLFQFHAAENVRPLTTRNVTHTPMGSASNSSMPKQPSSTDLEGST